MIALSFQKHLDRQQKEKFVMSSFATVQIPILNQIILRLLHDILQNDFENQPRTEHSEPSTVTFGIPPLQSHPAQLLHLDALAAEHIIQ